MIDKKGPLNIYHMTEGNHIRELLQIALGRTKRRSDYRTCILGRLLGTTCYLSTRGITSKNESMKTGESCKRRTPGESGGHKGGGTDSSGDLIKLSRQWKTGSARFQ